MNKNLPLFLVLLFLPILVWSVINPFDGPLWVAEAAPALIGIGILLVTYRKFRFTNLVYVLVFVHAIILVIGAHYSYERMPLFNLISEFFGWGRNNYDKVGHFAQGFMPALVIREILLRLNVVEKRGWAAFISANICLSLSAVYEFIEWWSAVALGNRAHDFLGTQGYVWDTQSDMLMCLIGAIVGLVLLSTWHDRQLKRINT